MKISKVISIVMVLVGIIVFFIGLEIFGIILAVVGLFFFPKSSTTSTLDSFVDDDYYMKIIRKVMSLTAPILIAMIKIDPVLKFS